VRAAPRTRPNVQPVEAKLPPEVAAEVRAGIEEAMRGEFVDLTGEEMRRYIETGELTSVWNVGSTRTIRATVPEAGSLALHAPRTPHLP
jgi:hypothetical protein